MERRNRDLTPIEHAIVAAAAQAGWGIGTAIFIGREHAQAEYRYIGAHGGSRYATPRPAEIGCLHPKYWRIGDVLDVLVPAAACCVIAVFATALW
jgi:hypothetical protein